MAVAAEQRQSNTTEYQSDETMGSDAEIEKDQPRPTHGRILRVSKPVPTRWSSLYYCLEKNNATEETHHQLFTTSLEQ